MSSVINVVTKIFERIFVTTYGNTTVFGRFIEQIIRNNQFLIVGLCLTIIGFSVSLIKRLIHS